MKITWALLLFVVVLIIAAVWIKKSTSGTFTPAPRSITNPQGNNPASAAVDAYIAGQLREQHIPGLALGVVRDGTMIKAQGYGLANIELDVPVKPATIFQTG